MPLVKLAIKQPIFITMVLMAIMLVGLMSYLRMGVDLYPDISNPVISVNVSYPGASPEDAETLVTKPIEEAVSAVNGVRSISSTSRQGSSNVTINFEIGFNLQQGATEVREAIDRIRRSLPSDIGEPVLRRFDPNTSPFMSVALTVVGGDLSPIELGNVVQEIVLPSLDQISGVAQTNVSGSSIQEVGVELNASRMKARGVSPQQVVAAIQAQNVNQPLGTIQGTNANLPLRTVARFQTLDDIRKLVVARVGSTSVRLQDVANVDFRLKERQSLTRINGHDAVIVEMSAQSGANKVQTAGLIRQELQSISRDLPQLKFDIVSDDSIFIQESDRDVTVTLIIGAVLAAVTVLFFFRKVRNTLVTVAGLPVIVIGTFAVISWLGFTRNIISLMALSLSIGLLIDDAIVVRENIFRHMENGASPRDAAEKATGEIAFAIIAISLTIVAIFIPVAFTTGQVGVLLKQFGITVSVAVMISLFEAFTFAPLLITHFAKSIIPEHENTGGEPASILGTRRGGASWIERLRSVPSLLDVDRVWPTVTSSYKKILAWSLHHRLLVMGVALAMFVLSLSLVYFLPTSFFPNPDPGEFIAGINLPPGTTLAQTDQLTSEIERLALSQPEVTQVFTRVGQGGQPSQGTVIVTLNKVTPTETVIRRFRSLFSKYGGAVVFSQRRQFLGVGGGGGGAQIRSRPVLIAVLGPTSLESLTAVSDQVIEHLRNVPGLLDIDKDLPPQEPELHIILDRERIAKNGVSAAAVSTALRTLVQGNQVTQVGWTEPPMDVTVQLRQQDRLDTSAIVDLPISGAGGNLWPLRQFARIEQGSGPAVLNRQDRQYQILVGANVEGRSLGAVVPDINNAMANLSLPAGVTWRFAGQQANTESAFSSLFMAMILGLVFVYMVLASQFGSFLHPLTVMIALPLSAIGAMLALVAARADMTIIAMIGIILLLGLATKNSILLVDFIIRYRREGQERTEAVIAAGPVRLRPILMTTLAMVLGMVPTALGIGAAGAFRAPMAIAVIGGMLSSTLLSLVVVPVFYTLMDDAVVAVTRLLHRGNVSS